MCIYEPSCPSVDRLVLVGRSSLCHNSMKRRKFTLLTILSEYLLILTFVQSTNKRLGTVVVSTGLSVLSDYVIFLIVAH